jgi:DNA-binding MarR family transcriptional regulator
VNWFSIEKLVFSEQTEFRHLVKTLKTLFLDIVSDTEIVGDIETILSDILTIHYFLRQKNEILQEKLSKYQEKIVATVFDNLTSKQKIILREIANMNGVSLTLTAMIGILSKKLDVAPSTIRWNLVALRNAGLINAGNKDNKGIPVRFTEIGRLTALVLTEEHAISHIETKFVLEVDVENTV